MAKSRRQLLVQGRAKIAKKLGDPCLWNPAPGNTDNPVDIIVRQESVTYDNGTSTLEWVASLPFREYSRGDKFAIIETSDWYQIHERLEADEGWLRLLVVPIEGSDLETL